MRLPIFLRQTGGLLKKQFILSYRVIQPTIWQILAPFAICFFLWLLQQLVDYMLKSSTPHPNADTLLGIPRCTALKGGCYALAYGPSDVPWVKELALLAAATSGLNPDTDLFGFAGDVSVCDGVVLPIEQRECRINQMNKAHKTMYNHFTEHPMKIDNAVLFTSAFFSDLAPVNTSMGTPVDTGYLLWYNQTALQSTVLQAKRTIDQAILRKQSGWQAKLEVDVGIFPKPPSRLQTMDITTQQGGLWFYLPPCTIFFFILVELVTEKDTRLRIGMRMMGLRSSAYWLSWFVYAVLMCTFSTLVLMASAAIFGFDAFTNANQAVIFLIFFLFGMSMVFAAFFLATAIKTCQTAQTAGYGIVLLGFVFQSIIAGQNGMFLNIIFGGQDMASWVVIVRWIMNFLPPVHMAKAYNDVARLSAPKANADGVYIDGPGFRWNDLYTKQYESKDDNLFGLEILSPAPVESFGWLFFCMAVYGVLCWYCDNVVPGEHGSSQPLWFFFKPSYWGFHGSKKSRAVGPGGSKIPEQFKMHPRCRGDDDVGTERAAIDRWDGVHNDAEAGTGQGSTPALTIAHLSKVYKPPIRGKGFPALVDLSLRVQSGEILGLLGHNGAGKTTLINVLTGITPPTEGMALVYGNDIITNPTEVRATTGVCPQYDILWGMLSAEEHMNLFCTLKGVPNNQEEIRSKLTLVGLWKIKDQKVHSFSGGMKRRLSVAMSAIGDPKIIYMDEPTTGLDPVNRRGVWELVLQMRAGRAIILTTHSMQEADVLCDRIGMMAKGYLCCLGTSLHLKQKYGNGYHIHVMAFHGHQHAVEDEIMDLCPAALIGDRDGAGLEVTIPYRFANDVPAVLQFLEREAATTNNDRRVREWGLLQTSLESVFCQIMDEHEFKVEDNKNVEEEQANSPTAGDQMLDNGKPETRPLRAMLYKNLVLQRRQKGTNCCQCCTPILVLLIMLALQFVVKSQVSNTKFSMLVPSSPRPATLNFDYSLVTPFQSSTPSKPAGIRKQELRKVMSLHHLPLPVLPSVPKGISVAYEEIRLAEFEERNAAHSVNNLNAKEREFKLLEADDEKQNYSCLTFFYATINRHQLSELGQASANGTKDAGTLLSHFPQTACALEGGNGFNSTTVQSPYFEFIDGSFTHLQDRVMTTMNGFQNFNWARLKQPPQLYQLPDAILSFDNVDKSTVHLKYRFAVYDGQYLLYNRPNNFTRVVGDYGGRYECGADCKDMIRDLGRVKLMDALHTGFTELVTGVEKTQVTGGSSSGSAAADLPYFMNVKWLQSMPYFAEDDIVELVERFGQFLYPIAMSIQLPLYMYIIVMEKEDRITDLMRSMGLTNFSYFFANYIFFIGLYLITFFGFWIVGGLIQLRFFVGTNPGIIFLLFIGWGHALISMAFFLASLTKTKRTASIIGYAIAFLGTIVGLMLGSVVFGLDDIMPMGLNLIPMFAFTRGIAIVSDRCGAPAGCFKKFEGEIGTNIGFLYLDTVLWFILSLYFNAVIASHAEAVTKHPLFFLMPIWNKLKGLRSQSTLHHLGQPGTPTTVRSMSDSRTGADVLAEERRILDNNFPPDAPLVVKQLRKQYANGKVALRGVSWVVEKGECLGYLGENGCGKTTSMRMLTGSLAPTSGTAFVGGYDIRNDINKVRLVVGVCPQFSVVWPDLSCREHALFYARLKGIPPKKEKEEAEKALKEVGLLDFQHRHAGKLSGGMKRRLSIAIALVGGSRIVFLDEPTTGLDPVSRKGVWRVLLKAREGRAVVLTTHAMEEAELLCNRIAILAHGRMMCIGTQQKLMEQLNAGYMLTINFSCSPAEAHSFIFSLFPEAVVHQQYQGSCVYRLPTTVKPSFVFESMQRSATASAGVTNWGYSQVGLEEVFTEVIEEAHRQRDEEERRERGEESAAQTGTIMAPLTYDAVAPMHTNSCSATMVEMEPTYSQYETRTPHHSSSSRQGSPTYSRPTYSNFEVV